MIGDNRYLLIRRILENAGGTPLPGDLETDLLEKYLIVIGGTPLPGDDFNVLLRKIIILKGGTPTPGDNEWNLLAKWLQAEGECRSCGDMIIDLWRKIFFSSSVIPPVANGLLNGLTAYWKLDENSPRLDSRNGYHLTENGTVGSVAGALNNAASFNNSVTNYLSNSSPDLGSHDGTFSVSTWVKLRSTAERIVFGKADPPSFFGWSIRVVAGPFFALESSDNVGIITERVVSDVLISTGVLYHIATSFSVDDGVGHIWVNNQKVSDLHAFATDAAVDFEMGKSLDADIDETAVWIGRAISDADVVALYNGGIPLPFSQYTI